MYGKKQRKNELLFFSFLFFPFLLFSLLSFSFLFFQLFKIFLLKHVGAGFSGLSESPAGPCWAPLSNFWKVEPDEEYDIEWLGGIFVFRRYNFQYTKTKSFAITGLTAHMIYEVAKAAFSDDGDDDETIGSTRQRKKQKKDSEQAS